MKTYSPIINIRTKIDKDIITKNENGAELRAVGWTILKKGTIDLWVSGLGQKGIVHTIAHEIFHIFGLKHCTDKTCLMYQYETKPITFKLCRKCHKKFKEIMTHREKEGD